MARDAIGLASPSSDFSALELSVREVNPNKLVRISSHNTNEPYFHKSGVHRFDDNNPVVSRRFGTCYFGMKLSVAMAETLLHNESPENGYFSISSDSITSRFVLHFEGSPLTLANLTGASLRRMGGHAELSGTSSYGIPQEWSKAIHRHPQQVDGFVYISRHLNTDKAIALFDRAKAKVKLASATPLPNYPQFARVARQLGIRAGRKR